MAKEQPIIDIGILSDADLQKVLDAGAGVVGEEIFQAAAARDLRNQLSKMPQAAGRLENYHPDYSVEVPDKEYQRYLQTLDKE